MARIEVMHEARNAAALAGAVTAFEHDDQAFALLLDVALQLDEFELKLGQVSFVFLALQFLVVRVAAASQRFLLDLVR